MRSNITSKQMHMETDHLLTITISAYRTYVEKGELSLPVQHNFSPDDNSGNTVTISLRDVIGMFLPLQITTDVENRLWH
ncbi:hypothetical protein TNCV_2009351 [Trichonephila clavipes]|nr:hypothetical protein TNCV_2009351 [Trichonephila clavipes]